MTDKIKVFETKQVRTHWNADEEEWYFSVVDVVSVLTDNDYQTARNYWKVLRKRLSDEGSELVTNCNRLKMLASDGKMRFTDCLDTNRNPYQLNYSMARLSLGWTPNLIKRKSLVSR